MSIQHTNHGASATAIGAAAGIRVEAHGLSRWVRGGRRVLHDVSLTVAPGELVAVVGGSGSGKSTLLEALAGVRAADEGTVRYDGAELHADLDAFRSSLGYVPQDDIIHRELPLRTTLRYAARLRLPAGTTAAQAERAVDDALAALDLQERADVTGGSLSGGQRKRASIAVELLTDPRVFFLDEPTSGLEPATGAAFMRLLRRLADSGRTVVVTTHSVQDIGVCDRVAFLARDGHLAYTGPPDAALGAFGVARHEEIYERLADVDTPAAQGRAPSLGRGPVREQRAPIARRRRVHRFAAGPHRLRAPVGAPHPAHRGHPRPQPAHGRDPRRIPGGDRRDVRDPVPPRRVRPRRPGLERGDHDPLLDRLRRLLLRADLRPAADRDGAPDRPARAAREPAHRPVRHVEGRGAAAAAGRGLGPDARRAAPARPPAGGRPGRLRGARGHARAQRDRRRRPRAARLRDGLRRGAGDDRAADALLPAGPVLRGHPRGPGHGARRAAHQLRHVGPVGVRGARPRARLERVLSQGASPLGPPLLAQYGESFSRDVWVNWLILGGMGALLLAATCLVLARRCRAAGR